jgi:aspartate/methionine/tyrosine aminotransferase
MREEKDFRLDPNELADLITDRTKLIVLNSPHNPTGSVVTEQDVKDIAAAIGDRDIMVLSDEIYSRLIFAGKHHSLMSLPGWKDRVIMLDGWSKTFAMTGWRLGYGVMRKDLAAHFGRLMTNVNSCSASFTQMAGMEALKGDQSSVEHMCAQFKARRDKFIAGLNKVPGFSCRLPHGAFYAFPNTKKTGWDSRKLAEAMLNEAGVACLSGTAFGAFGEGYLRFSIANSMENLDEALNRIEAWAKKNL